MCLTKVGVGRKLLLGGLLSLLPLMAACEEFEQLEQASSVKVEAVAGGLEVPWDLDFAPDGRIFISERPGRVRVIQDGELLDEPFLVLEDAFHHFEGGLLGLALDPQFQDNGYVYLYYSYQDNRAQRWNRVVRLREQDGLEPEVLLDGIPASPIHNGGRIRFGPDGYLYITTGDAGEPDLAQDLDSLAGKILRIAADGSLPEDNPFPDSPVYSYGHRNPQGLAWHPETGDLYSTEHGEAARDEVNLVRPGGNFGWPVVEGIAGDPRFLDPVVESGGDTWAPAGAAFYADNRLPEPWRGLLFFGALRGQALHWMDLGQEVVHGTLFEEEYGRIRAVAQGPDGYLYFTSSNRDQWGAEELHGDDHLYRLVPEP